jgi:endo-1,4-beta-D-glucanase Y
MQFHPQFAASRNSEPASVVRSRWGKMRRLSVSTLSSLAASALLVGAAGTAEAQQLGGTFPFPSTNLEAGRFRTEAITTFEIEDLYNKWRSDVLVSCGNDQRVQYTENPAPDTRSEGIGYGMVIAAYMGDQQTFEGLWSYYQRFSQGGLMDWLVNDCNTRGDQGSAADADIDAALGLMVADKQFPNQGYGADAQTLLNAIRTRLVEVPNRTCNGVLLPGSNYSGCGCANPSYLPPGYYAAYAALDTANAAVWNNARAATYTLLDTAAEDNTGFVPAWSDAAGSINQSCTFQVQGGGEANEYQSDAARTPWRVATDYMWTGDARAQQFLQRMADFVATSLPLVRIVDRYSRQGTPIGENVDTASGRRGSFHMGGFATAMTARSQEDLDRFTAAWNSVYRAGDLNADGTLRAYNGSLALLYGLLVTGSMWNPAGPSPTPIAEPAIPPQGDNILVNGDFTAGLRGWTTQSLADNADLDSDGYAQHLGGELHFHVLRNQPDFAYGLQFYQDIPLTTGQNYLVTLRARATEPRALRLAIGEVDDRDGDGQAYETYAALTDAEAESFAIGTTAATYTFVFQSPVTDPGARFNLQFGDSAAEVILDDVSIAPTTLPPTPVVQVEGAAPTDPGTPQTPGTAPGGTPAATPGDGDLGGTVNPGVDAPGAPGGGGVGAPNPDDAVGAPAAPVGAPGASSCSAANPNVCAPYACSTTLNLCYDTNTGYVWDPSQRGGLGDWTKPPRGVGPCAADQVFWPKFPPGLCYIPETGWIYNPAQGGWVFYGLDFTEGKKPESDGSCAIAGAPGSSRGSSWMLMGLLGASLGLSFRRRRS